MAISDARSVEEQLVSKSKLIEAHDRIGVVEADSRRLAGLLGDEKARSALMEERWRIASSELAVAGEELGEARRRSQRVPSLEAEVENAHSQWKISQQRGDQLINANGSLASERDALKKEVGELRAQLQKDSEDAEKYRCLMDVYVMFNTAIDAYKKIG